MNEKLKYYGIHRLVDVVKKFAE